MAWVFGHRVEVDWGKFTPGSSFFIPCIDRDSVEKSIRKECKAMGLRCVTKQVIENNICGVRVWRVIV